MRFRRLYSHDGQRGFAERLSGRWSDDVRGGATATRNRIQSAERAGKAAETKRIGFLRFCLSILLFFSTVAVAQERDALVFTSYDLAAEIVPSEQSIAVRGKVILFNLSRNPQETARLQISSSLRWATVRAHGKTFSFTHSSIRSDE